MIKTTISVRRSIAMIKKTFFAIAAITFIATILVSTASHAFMPNPGEIVLTQSDGTSFAAVRKSLDGKSWTETEAGHMVAYSYEVSGWTYALPDENDFFRPSTLVVGQDSPPNLNLTDQEKADKIMSQADKRALYVGEDGLLSASQTVGAPVYTHGTGPYAAHDQHPRLNPTSIVHNMVVPVFSYPTEMEPHWDNPSEVNKHEDFALIFDQADFAPDYRDRDNDGLPDRWESTLRTGEGYEDNTDPVHGDRWLQERDAADEMGGTGDYDEDGLTNYEEYFYGTNPIHYDTDGDSLSDGWEIHYGQTDPLDDGTKYPEDAIEVGWIPYAKTFAPNTEDTFIPLFIDYIDSGDEAVIALTASDTHFEFVFGDTTYDTPMVLYFVRINSDGDTWMGYNHNGKYGNPDKYDKLFDPDGTGNGDAWSNFTEYRMYLKDGGPSNPPAQTNEFDWTIPIVPYDPFDTSIEAHELNNASTSDNTDGDGVGNAWELFYFGTLARCQEATGDGQPGHEDWGDFDGDNIPDLEEWAPPLFDHAALGANAVRGYGNFPGYLDPTDTDSDDDGLTDGYEHKYSMNPFDPSGDNGSFGDLDNDGYLNGMEQYGLILGGDRFVRAGDEFHDWYCGWPHDQPDAPRLVSTKNIPYSVRSYFRDVSTSRFNEYYPESYHDRKGQFVFQSKVAPWVELSQTRNYYSAKPEEMLPEIINWLESKRYPFKAFDGNNDGWIDNMVIIVEKGGQEFSGDPDDMLTQILVLDEPLTVRSWTLNRDNTGPDIEEKLKLQRVTIIPEYITDYNYITYSSTGDTEGSDTDTIYPIGPIGHLIGYQFDLPGGEDGKSVGLPALYDTDLNNSSAGIGMWGLMGNGCWNNSGVNPAPPSAWSKYRLGWVDPEFVEMDGSWYWITAPKVYSQIQMIKGNKLNSDEYFLLEVRNKRAHSEVEMDDVVDSRIQVSKFELPMPIPLVDMPYDNFGKVQIFHVDDSKGNISDNDVNQLDENDTSDFYRVSVVQSDNKLDLEHFDLYNLTGNLGDEGDLWPRDLDGADTQDLEGIWDPQSRPNTDSHYVTDALINSYRTNVRINKLQPGKGSGVWRIADPEWIRWVTTDDETINDILRHDHRWLYYCPDKDLKKLTVQHPNGYHTRYPFLSPNGKVYGDYEELYNEIFWRPFGINEIVWDYTDSTGDSVMIQLYKTDDPLLTIAASTANDGYFEWVISPAQTALLEEGTDYLVKISDLSDSTVYDYSDDYFTIDDSRLLIEITNSDIADSGIVIDDYTDTEAWYLTWNTDVNPNDTWIETVQIDIYQNGSFLTTVGTADFDAGVMMIDFGTLGLFSGTGYQIMISFVDRPEVYHLSDVFHLHLLAPTINNIMVGKNAIYNVYTGDGFETAPLLVTSLPTASTLIHVQFSDTSVSPVFALYQDDVFLMDITGDITIVDTQTVSWEFPIDTYGDNLRIGIEDSGNEDDVNFSDYFSILPPYFIIAPNGGDEFNKWDYLPFGQFEYTGNYDEVNIWFASSLPERKKPTDPPFTCRLEWADASVTPLSWQIIDDADSIELPVAEYDTAGILVCSGGNFVWNVDGMDIEKCLIRIVSNDIGPYIDTIDTPLLIDQTEPTILNTWVWDNNDSRMDAVNATDVAIKSPIAIEFSEAMDRYDKIFQSGVYNPEENDWIFANGFQSYWPLRVYKRYFDEDWGGTENVFVPGTAIWENTELRFYPEETFDPNTTYMVYLDVDARDNRTVGNYLDGPITFEFTTGDAPEGYEADTDGDGMPDWYEYEYRWPSYQYNYDEVTYGYDWTDNVIEGLNPFVDDANEDYDHDGVFNFVEYTRGSSPIDSLDFPVIHVDDDAVDTQFGTAEFPFDLIQEGIDAAMGSEWVMVHPGTYYENINMNGVNVRLVSEDVDDSETINNTIIDGDGNGPVITINSGETYPCQITGFTITGGSASQGGGILCINNSTPLINKNIIIQNSAQDGAGVYIQESTPEFVNNVVAQNTADSNGGGLYLESTTIDIINNTIADNIATGNGNAIYCDSAIVELRNVILWDNDTSDSVQVSMFNESWVYISYSDVEGWTNAVDNSDSLTWGWGNLNDDPEFVDAPGGDYHVEVWSLCVDGGDPDDDYTNEPWPHDYRVNIGAYGNTSQAATVRDSDYDGLVDPLEILWGLDPTKRDSDEDGLGDMFEAGWNGDYNEYDPPDTSMPMPNGSDMNALSLDSDEDGMLDYWEVNNWPTTNPIVDDSLDDPDADGLPNIDEHDLGCDPGDTDTDNDGLSDGDEVNVYNSDPHNPDTDGDGLNDGDEIDYGTLPDDPDSDGDGLNDGDEVYIHGTDPADDDSDGDGINDGDEVDVLGTDPNDTDTDGDRLSDYEEEFEVYGFLTDPTLFDTDGDTMDDGWEIANGLDPTQTASDTEDSDGDGLTDIEEYNLNTHPNNTDSDGDGLTDPYELDNSLDPNDTDTDGDGMPDGWENDNKPAVHPRFADGPLEDDDNDSLTDIREYQNNSDPNNPDTDGDTLIDGDEVDIYGTDPSDSDTDGDGLGDGEEVNTTGTDPLVPDTDGDSLTDGEEVNTYGTDPNDTDTDNDLMPDGWEGPNSPPMDPLTADALDDYDTDGLDNISEMQNNCDPGDSDTDNDGMPDGWEVGNSPPMDPLTADASDDYDTDGLTNIREMQNSCDPGDSDTDGDNLNDGDEIDTYGTDPLDPDTDGDTLTDGDEVNIYGTDPNDTDTDDDGLSDGWEVANGEDPLVPYVPIPATPVADITSLSDTETMISWDSAGTLAGTKYNVWYADEAGGPWQLLPGGPYDETGGVIDVIDTLPPGTPRRFYKVEAYIE
jgi:Big-like domain-containing protein/thrombospondin type 3 repeat protein